MLFFWGWKRLGLKKPGGGQAWTRTVKVGESLPEGWDISFTAWQIDGCFIFKLSNSLHGCCYFVKTYCISNTWGAQEEDGAKSIPMQTRIAHGSNVGRGCQILRQTRQVEGPFPGIPLVQEVFRVQQVLITKQGREREAISFISVSCATIYIVILHAVHDNNTGLWIHVYEFTLH